MTNVYCFSSVCGFSNNWLGFPAKDKVSLIKWFVHSSSGEILVYSNERKFFIFWYVVMLDIGSDIGPLNTSNCYISF